MYKAVGFDRYLWAIFIQPQLRTGCEMRKKSRVLRRHQRNLDLDLEIRISDLQQSAKSKNEFKR